METRKDDIKTQSHFRAERLFNHGEQWFFHTREGSFEGPYDDELEASHKMKMYIDNMTAMHNGELNLAPLT